VSVADIAISTPTPAEAVILDELPDTAPTEPVIAAETEPEAVPETVRLTVTDLSRLAPMLPKSHVTVPEFSVQLTPLVPVAFEKLKFADSTNSTLTLVSTFAESKLSAVSGMAQVLPATALPEDVCVT
jgi:hypothetical protein